MVWHTAWPCCDIRTLRALTRACTLTRACIHRRVMAACLRTVCPRTNACSLTSPFNAFKALLACIQKVITASQLCKQKLLFLSCSTATSILQKLTLTPSFLNCSSCRLQGPDPSLRENGNDIYSISGTRQFVHQKWMLQRSSLQSIEMCADVNCKKWGM